MFGDGRLNIVIENNQEMLGSAIKLATLDDSKNACA